MKVKGKQTKSAILQQGLALASIKGLGGITIGVLADEVGMSKSGLYGHFKSKENLQLEILSFATERFIEEVVAPSLKATRGEPRVHTLFERWVKWADANYLPGGCIFIDAIAEFDDQPGPIRDLLVKTQRDWMDTLATAARIAVEEKHFRADLDPVQFAYDIYSVAYGYHFAYRLLEDTNARKYANNSIKRILADAHSKS